MSETLRLVVDAGRHARREQRRKEWWASLGVSPAEESGENAPLLACLQFGVDGLASPLDARRLQARLARIFGVQSVTVDFRGSQISLNLLSDTVDEAHLEFVIADAGYHPWPLRKTAASAEHEIVKLEREYRWRALGTGLVALFVTAATLSVRDLGVGSDWFQDVVADASLYLSLAVLWLGRGLFEESWRGLRQRQVNNAVLWAVCALAVYLAAIWSFFRQQPPLFEMGALIVAAWHIGRWLESRARMMAQAGLREFELLKPQTVTVVRKGESYQLEVESIKAGDLILVGESEIVAADGLVIEGRAVVNEKALVGHSVKREVAADSWVLAGSLCESGHLLLEPKCPFEASYFGQLMSSFKESKNHHSPIQERWKAAATWVAAIALLGGVFAFGVQSFVLQHSFVTDLELAVALVLCLSPWILESTAQDAFERRWLSAAGQGALIRSNAVAQSVFESKEAMIFPQGVTTTLRPTRVLLEASAHVEQRQLAEIVATMLSEIDPLLSHSFREFAVEHLAVDAYQQLPALDGFESLGQWGGRATIGGHSVLFGQRAMLDAAGVILPTAPQSAGTQIELLVLQDDLYRGRVVFEYRAVPDVEDALGFLKDEGLDLQIVDLGVSAQNIDGRLVVGAHKCHRAALSAASVSVSVLERGKVFVAWPSVTLTGPPVASFLALWREMSTLRRQLKRRLWIALLGFCIAPLALMGWLPIWAAVLWSVAIPSLARLGK